MLPSSVAVFWDCESCELPSTEPTYAVVAKIRRIAHQYGSIKAFKAYVQHPAQPTVRSMSVHSELQCCGITLVDCLHGGLMNVADKLILAVDMMAYAVDTPAPATIVLISGDRGFAYAVSILSLRQYKTVLVAPSTADVGLKGQADVVYTWPSDFLSISLSTSCMATPSSSATAASREEPPRQPVSAALEDTSRKQQPTPSSTMSSRMLVDFAEDAFFGTMLEPSRATSRNATEAPSKSKDQAASGSVSAAAPTSTLPPVSSATSVVGGKAPVKDEIVGPRKC
ncbi:hypothetical protein FKP32DRAFT_1564491 [Trametes sanguinea]|nr:hypothetical protein FKP32DRAFT_1564491 [Trametes sanguinea]